MIRRYSQHDFRHVTELSGVWDFAFLGNVDPAAIDVAGLDFPDCMTVPGSFDATPRYAGKRGLAAYRTRLFLPDAGAYRLVFHGVNHWCAVYLDGKQIAVHNGGFTRFNVDFTSPGPGQVALVVLVDNRFDPERIPLHYEYFDWYHFGGISRPVALHRLSSTWINAMRVVTEDYQPRRLRVVIDYGTQNFPESVALAIAFDGEVVLAETVLLDAAAGQISRELSFPQAALWSPDAPNLHFVHARLGDDDLRERIGIRQVTAVGQEIQINGEAVRLLGFNRHEAHPEFGCGLPDGLIVADVQQLKDLGCNFVRGSHYPQDERFLDLCDEVGMCVWNEVIGWQHTVEHLTDPRFVAAQRENAAEMVAMSFNHAAVILYGLLNESMSNDARSRPGYESIIGLIRQLDPTRLITFASNHPMDDVCLDLADVVSINTYPGWYIGSIEEIPATMEAILQRVDASEGRGKPVIISEIGAEGIYGWRDWNEARWSEPYQAQLLDTVIRYLFAATDRVCGLSIWLFGDFRTSESLPRILGRGRAFNNKGVVDEYRRPKQAYEVVKRHYLDLR